MFAAESYTSRHYIAIVAMACLCVLLGGPSYAAGAESLIIAGATYYVFRQVKIDKYVCRISTPSC